MGPISAQPQSYPSQLRLLVEELCCDLCRFEHVVSDGLPPETVQIDREYELAGQGGFADIRVAPGQKPPYFVEVKYGYTSDAVLPIVRRKYGQGTSDDAGISKLILVIDVGSRSDWPALETRLRECLRPGLELQIWDETHLVRLLADRFGVDVPVISEESLLDVRQAVDRAKGFYAFGGGSQDDYEHDPLKAQLIWHFGFWKLHQLMAAERQSAREVFPPGLYKGVVVLLADLCSFSSYVRDTPDNLIIRESLTSFYSKTLYQIINDGGMFYQFVGDEVIGLYGLPESQADGVRSALHTARSLVSIGKAVSQNWQRRIDRVQTSAGVHMGMAVGDLEIVSLRPFSRTHMGAIGDTINVAARLMSVAGPSELVVTNSLYQQSDQETQAGFQEVESVDAKNVGRIKAWRMRFGQA